MLGFAVLAGLAVAVVAAGLMLPITFPSAEQKRLALLAALVDRFLLGFVIGPVAAGLDANGMLVGALVGLGLSLPTAMITRSYAPVLGIGLVAGVGVGLAYSLVF